MDPLSGHQQVVGSIPTARLHDLNQSREAGNLFEHYEVVTGSAKRQTVLSGFFLGGAIADLAVVSVDENDDRRLSWWTSTKTTSKTSSCITRPPPSRIGSRC